MPPISADLKFIDIIPFHHPIFNEITWQIQNYLENRPVTIFRRLQIRSLLFVSFNQYLTNLLLELPEADSQVIINDLTKIDDEAELLEAVANGLNKPVSQIITNYLGLFKRLSHFHA